MQVKTSDGGFEDVNILKVTPDNFIVPKGEEHLYHCRIEVKKFDANTGERLSIPRIQIFGKKIFESFVMSDLKKQGYTIDILHNPNEWLKQNKEKMAEIEKARAEAQAQAMEAKKAAEREAMKAELKAELMAELKSERKRKNISE